MLNCSVQKIWVPSMKGSSPITWATMGPEDQEITVLQMLTLWLLLAVLLRGINHPSARTQETPVFYQHP